MLAEPPSLQPQARAARPSSWARQHVAGLAALLLGGLAFVVVSLQSQPLWATPDWRITAPFFAITAAAAVLSLVRREGAPAMPLLGAGLAAVTLVLGWFVVVAAVVAATAALILILSMVM